MEITSTPTIILLSLFNTINTYDGPIKAISEFNLVAAAINSNGIAFIDPSTNVIQKTFTLSTKVTTRHITTNPNLGIIYFGDDANKIFALSYI